MAPYQVSIPSTLSIPHLRSQIGVDHFLVMLDFLGGPSAIFLPKFRTVIWSETFITRLMSCSTSRMVMPRSQI